MNSGSAHSRFGSGLVPPSHQAYLAASSTMKDDSWFLDSGATHHVTADSSNMASQSDYKGKGKLVVGNGTSFSISHVGSTLLPASKPFTLYNILLVPSITKNLISISKFTCDNDVVMEFKSQCCYIKDKATKTILMQGFFKNGLYQLEVPCPHQFPTSKFSSGQKQNLAYHVYLSKNHSGCISDVPSSTCIKFESIHFSLCSKCDSCNKKSSVVNMWHHRLGHPTQAILSEMLNTIHVPHFNSTLSFCTACQYGKLHQFHFPSSLPKTIKPFQLVHFDVWGPSSHISLEGYLYYVFFVDDYTKYTWIYPLKLKSEAKNVFLQFNTYVERQFDTKIKCFQTDWGGEYRQLLPMLQSLGIVFRHPCHHTHQQQGMAERKHRHIVEIGLTLLAQISMDLKFW